MSTALVYLHIPKSAGSSHRGFLEKVYGQQNYFWYGKHSDAQKFKLEQVSTFPAIGGHRPLSFYPKNFDALYTSVVRDPVARAVSLYNYYTAIPERASSQWTKVLLESQSEWRERGLDPNSMIKSIENCRPFRKEVTNMQCAYLSRYKPTFEGVQKSLEETDMIVGVFEQLPAFNEFLKNELGLPLDHNVKANMGKAGYASAIYQEPGLTSLLRSINKEDQALYDFVRLAHAGLYVGANNLAAVRETVPSIDSRSVAHDSAYIEFNWNRVHIFCKGIVSCADGKKSMVPLIVDNQSDSHIVFSQEQDCLSAIGWRLKNAEGEPIEGLEGLTRVDQTICAKESKKAMLVLDLGKIHIEHPAALFIEFCIVHDGEWMWDKAPLSCAWASLII